MLVLVLPVLVVLLLLVLLLLLLLLLPPPLPPPLPPLVLLLVVVVVGGGGGAELRLVLTNDFATALYLILVSRLCDNKYLGTFGVMFYMVRKRHFLTPFIY
eukprot:COSAG06_NODE_541_length_14471_cov_35.139229_10_plen_101_part_00